jgi:hypothetical protein
MEAEQDSAPGWDAIDRALSRLYLRQEPKQYGPLGNGGNEPLAAIRAYPRITPVPHWHFVTYGFSELHGKTSDDPLRSGFGFELTFRLANPDDSEEPPAWVPDFLQNLARYVFESGNVFHAGHYLNANGPIAADTATRIQAVAFAPDPELPAIDTENGRVEFLQAVGITNEEEFALKRWSTLRVLDVFLDYLPLWVTELDRESLLDDPQVAERLHQGSAQEGSSSAMVYTEQLEWRQRKRLLRRPTTEIVLDSRQVGELLALLPLRLPFAKPFSLIGPSSRIVFEPAPRNGAQADGEALHLRLNEATLRNLVACLRTQEGRYQVEGLEAVEVVVRKSESQPRPDAARPHG